MKRHEGNSAHQIPAGCSLVMPEQNVVDTVHMVSLSVFVDRHMLLGMCIGMLKIKQKDFEPVLQLIYVHQAEAPFAAVEQRETLVIVLQKIF